MGIEITDERKKLGVDNIKIGKAYRINNIDDCIYLPISDSCCTMIVLEDVGKHVIEISTTDEWNDDNVTNIEEVEFGDIEASIVL